jgi:LacI family transcriptional regulator
MPCWWLPHYVLIDRALPGVSANFVGVDDVKVGSIATEHFIAVDAGRWPTWVASGSVRVWDGWRATGRPWSNMECRPVTTTSSRPKSSTRQETRSATKRRRTCSAFARDPTASSAVPTQPPWGAILAVAEASLRNPPRGGGVGLRELPLRPVPACSADQRRSAERSHRPGVPGRWW